MVAAYHPSPKPHGPRSTGVRTDCPKRVWLGLRSGQGISNLYQGDWKAISAFWRPPPDLLLQGPVADGPPPAWAPRRAMRSPDIHSVLVRPGFVPICKRSRIVRRRIHEGWYPPNIERQLWGTRVPGVLGESGWAYRAAGASPIYANPIGTRFWHFRAVMETSRGRIATRGAVRGPRAHEPRCARLTSILGPYGVVKYAGGASRVSFEDLRRSPFRALGLAMRAPERSVLRPNLVRVRVRVNEARSPPTY